ncbi:MAG: competence protein ComEC family protein, partial [Candidatus Omnitrophica bacterium]|nr:competence protein ComEC family protein [Candidatus Omnitrophota bacterium]
GWQNRRIYRFKIFKMASLSLLITLAGLIIGISLTSNNYPWYIAYIFFSIPFLFILKNKRILYFSSGILLGVITTYINIQSPLKYINYCPSSIKRAEGTIISSRTYQFSTEYVVRIHNITTENGKTEKVGEKVLLKTEKKEYSNYPSGTHLIMYKPVFKNIQPPKNPSNFDYIRYIERKGITMEVKAENMKTGSLLSILSIFQKARNILVRKIDRWFLYFPEEKELLLTITMGKERVPYFLQSSGIRSGTYHLLVISGLHIGFILLFLKVLFIPLAELNNRHPKFFSAFTLIIIWFYTGITGFRVPVVRAVLMCSLFFIGEILERDMDIITSIMAAALLLLLINPSNLFDASFQLSFTATLGIVLFWRRFKLLDKNYIKAIILTGLAAQMAVFPLLLYHFGYFYPSGLLNNVIFVPFTGGILILSIFSFIIPVLFPLLRVLLTGFIRGITLSAQFSPSIHFSPSIPLVISFYAFCILLLYSPRRKIINTALLSIIFLSIPLHFLPLYQKTEKNEEIIYFLSFTEPSVVYIKNRAATVFLADHYRTREVENILIPLLSREDVKDITLFYTSISYNHTATLNTLKKRFNIKKVYEVEDIRETFFYPYIDIYYHKTYPYLFKFIPYGNHVHLSGITVEAAGYENETVSYIINSNRYSILVSPFTGTELSGKFSDKSFDVAYIEDVKKTKKIMENLSSLKYNYLILPKNYKKFDKLPKAKEDILYLKQSAVKVFCNQDSICVKYHYQQ